MAETNPTKWVDDAAATVQASPANPTGLAMNKEKIDNTPSPIDPAKADKADWDAVEKEEGWHPVTLSEVFDGNVPESGLGKALEGKGYFHLDNGKWQSPDGNTVISDYTGDGADAAPVVDEVHTESKSFPDNIVDPSGNIIDPETYEFIKNEVANGNAEYAPQLKEINRIIAKRSTADYLSRYTGRK